MKRLGLFVSALLLAACAQALEFGDIDVGGLTNTITSSATVQNLSVSTLTVLGSGVSNVTVGANVAGHVPSLSVNAGASTNALIREQVNGSTVMQLYSSGSDVTLRTDTNIPLWLGANSTQLVRIDSSGIAPPQASAIDGTITPTRAGMMVYNTSTVGEICISTATNIGAWVQLRAITTPCTN